MSRASAVRDHLSALTTYFSAFGSDACFSAFHLDEDTASFKVKLGKATGEVSISFYERSSYPRSGALAYADGSDALMAAVDSISGDLGDRAALDAVIQALAKAVPEPPAALASQGVLLP